MKTVRARSRCWALTISSQSMHSRPDGPNKALGDPVRLWDLNRRPYDSGAFGLKHGIEAVRELAVVITNQKTNRLRPVAERPRDLPRLLRHPVGVGMGRTPSQVHAA